MHKRFPARAVFGARVLHREQFGHGGYPGGLLALAWVHQARIQGLQGRILSHGEQGDYVPASSYVAASAPDAALATYQAAVAAQRRHAHQCNDVSVVEPVQPRQPGRVGRADGRKAAQGRGQLRGVTLHAGDELDIAVAEFGFEEFDVPLNTAANGRVRDAQLVALADEYLQEPAPAQHQRLPPLQFDSGQRFDKPVTLGVLVQHQGKLDQHPRVLRAGFGQGSQRRGEVTCSTRIDHPHRQVRSLQRARRIEFLAASSHERHPRWPCREADQLLDTSRLVSHLHDSRLLVGRHLQGLTASIGTEESQVGRVIGRSSLALVDSCNTLIM